MEKEFLDVFRNLELKGELRALLEEVEVTKIPLTGERITSEFISAADSGFTRSISMHWRKLLRLSASGEYL